MFFPQFFILIDNLGVKENTVQLIFFRCIIQLLQGILLNHVIGVQEVNILALCPFQTDIASVSLLVVFRQMHGNHPAVFGRICIHDFPAAVRRDIIDTDDFNIFQGLVQHTVQACRKPRFHVIYRYNHSYFSHFSFSSIISAIFWFMISFRCDGTAPYS